MKTFVFALLIALAAGCSSKEATTKEAETPTETTVTDEAPPEEAVSGDAEDKGTFGELVDGATTLVIEERPMTADAPAGEPVTTTDAAEIAKFVEAIGPDSVASGAVPKCLPKYKITFLGQGEELATFGAVCSDNPAVILVRDGKAFVASDNEAALQSINDLTSRE